MTNPVVTYKGERLVWERDKIRKLALDDVLELIDLEKYSLWGGDSPADVIDADTLKDKIRKMIEDMGL